MQIHVVDRSVCPRVFPATCQPLGFLMLDTIQVGLRTERIVFVGDVGSVVGSMQYLVLFALFPLRRFFALFVLASQLFLPLLECCA